MSFWIKHLIIGAVLITLAAFFLLNQDTILALTQSNSSSPKKNEEISDAQKIDTITPLHTEVTTVKQSNTQPNKTTSSMTNKSKNAAAEGLSKFYANLNPDFDESGPKIRNNIVYLPDPQGDLVKKLEARRMVTRPLRKNWTGTKTPRPFRTGETILQKLSQYAKEDGLSIIWWLNRDFLVKSPFRVNKNVLQTAYQLAKSVEGHFQNGVEVFFCYQQRTIVVIDEAIPYLNEECNKIQLPGQNRRR